MPSLGEAPSGGARAFGYFGLAGIPGFKVTRCKSEIASGPTHSNGYVHSPLTYPNSPDTPHTPPY